MFELSEVERVDIRETMVGHLLNIDEKLAKTAATGLGIKSLAKPAKAAEPMHSEWRQSPI